MDKRKFFKAFSILLPAAAVSVAAMPDSVTAFSSATKTVETYSYFAMQEETAVAACAPFAGLLCAVTGGMAVGSFFSRKEGWFSAVLYTALAASVLAVLPVMVPTEPKVVPNVFVPILMAAEAALAFWLGRHKAAEPAARGPRLGE